MVFDWRFVCQHVLLSLSITCFAVFITEHSHLFPGCVIFGYVEVTATLTGA